MDYQLYYSPGACSMAAHIALQEAKAAYALQLVDLSTRAHYRPEYLAINPKARVPALDISGQARVLTELPAILVHVAQQHPQAGLLPADDPVQTARCLEWLAWLSGWVHSAGYGAIWRPERFSSNADHYDGIRAQGRRTVVDAYAAIEQQFADGRPHALASGYSVVDPFLLVLYRWGNRIGLDMHADCPAWSAASANLAQRPAVQAVLQREGVSLDG